MNREERRRAARRQRGNQLAHEVAAGYHCPDCTADTRLVEASPGVFVLRVFHDEPCPSYRAMKEQSP